MSSIIDIKIPKPRKKSKHYCNNATLLEAMIAYRDKVIESKKLGKEKPIIPDYIGSCLYLIATRLATKPNFAMYTYREEMVSDGLENAILYIDNFDPAKSSNPFSYFTQIIWFAFIRRIQKEKKQQYIKLKNMQNSFILHDLEDHVHGYESDYGESVFFDNEITGDFIKTYEGKLEEKRKKTQVKKEGIENFM